MRRQTVNNVNTGINLSTVNNELKKDNLNINDQSGSTTATATFDTSNEMFSVSQTPSMSSSTSWRHTRRTIQKERMYFWESYY